MSAADPSTHAGAPRRPRWLIALGAAALVLIVVGLVLVLSDSGKKSKPVKPGAAPEQVSAARLRAFAAGAGHPVYWAGDRAGTRLELTDTARGNVYVRYLTGAAVAGSPKAAFLTVGTYPKADAYATVRSQSTKKQARRVSVPGGGLAVWNPASRSVYVAYPDAAYLVEVYGPKRGQALRLVTDGAVVPVR